MDIDGVILLHGLGRTRRSMAALDHHLARQGFRTINLGYPSMKLDIRRIAEEHLAPAVERLRGGADRTVHFVGHSLGGIVVRRYLQDHPVPARTRLVMVGSPNSGSELADLLVRFRWYRWIMGPAAVQLGTGSDSIPSRLGPVPAQIGVIAGSRSCLPFSRRIFHGPNDGKVAVERTKLAGMADFLVVHCGHTFMTGNRMVMDQVVCFLRDGAFAHAVPPQQIGRR
jgi:pimeloyl-ACP methyl ester carboxylesterase